MPRAGRMARSLVAALLVVRALDEFTSFLGPGHLEQFHHELRASYGALGVMLAMPYVGSLLGNLFVARSDGTSRKSLAVGGAAALSLSMFANAAANGVIALSVAAFGLGVASTCLVEGGEMALANSTDGPLERTLARINLFGTFGDIAGPLLIAATRFFGVEWRWLFAASGLVVTAYTVVLVFEPFPAAPLLPADDEDPARFIVIL